jgi:hypothetical protein
MKGVHAALRQSTEENQGEGCSMVRPAVDGGFRQGAQRCKGQAPAAWHAVETAWRPGRAAVAWIALGALILVPLAGCWMGGPTAPSARLAGSVTLDGQSIEEGEIVFFPQGAGQARPESAPIVGGRYEAKHVPMGKVQVRFNATRKTGKMIAIPDSEEQFPEVVDIIPAKYAQGITIEVTGDNPSQDFQLTSR